MPNHLRQRITLVAPKTTLLRAKEFLVGVYPLPPPQGFMDKPEVERERIARPFCFNSVVPLPVEYSIRPYDPFGIGAERELWGVKWGTYDEAEPEWVDDALVYDFTTAWGTPEPIYRRLTELFDGLTIYVSTGREVYDLPWREVYRDGAGPDTIKYAPENIPDIEDDGETYKNTNHLLETHDEWVASIRQRTEAPTP